MSDSRYKREEIQKRGEKVYCSIVCFSYFYTFITSTNMRNQISIFLITVPTVTPQKFLRIFIIILLYV